MSGHGLKLSLSLCTFLPLTYPDEVLETFFAGDQLLVELHGLQVAATELSVALAHLVGVLTRKLEKEKESERERDRKHLFHFPIVHRFSRYKNNSRAFYLFIHFAFNIMFLHFGRHSSQDTIVLHTPVTLTWLFMDRGRKTGVKSNSCAL